LRTVVRITVPHSARLWFMLVLLNYNTVVLNIY